MDTNKFCEHLHKNGFILNPAETKLDGKWHNIKLSDNSTGFSAAYCILSDKVALYKNWRTGESFKYYDNEITTTKEFKDVSKLIKQKELEHQQKHFEASKLSFEKYKNIEHQKDLNCPYLEKKKVGNYGCKVDLEGNLVIPYQNEKGFIRTLQTIKPDNFKLFEKDGEMKGNFHKIHFNFVDKVENKFFGKIFIGEGYATMASVHEATGSPCIVAANAGNLKPVLEKLNLLYPMAQFVICADNDLKLREKTPGSEKWIWANPGVEAAIKCLDVPTNKPISIVVPNFDHVKNIDHGLTDFNDLHCHDGLDTVKEQISNNLLQIKQQHYEHAHAVEQSKTLTTEYSR